MNRVTSFLEKSFIPYLNLIKQCQKRVNKYVCNDMFRFKILLTQDRVGSRDKIKMGIKPLVLKVVISVIGLISLQRSVFMIKCL